MLLTDKTAFRVAAIVLLIVLAILVRIYGVVWKPAFDFGEVGSYQTTGFAGKVSKQLRHVVEVSPTRSYHSALTARYFYYKTHNSIPNWKKNVINAQISKGLEPLAVDYCPPAMAWLTSVAYHVAGAEYSWISKILASLIWIIGGWLIYAISRRFCSFEASYIASAIFLLIPFGIFSSRNSFPDALWLTSMLLGLLMIISYSEKPSTSRLIICILASAIAAFIKPLNILFIFAAYISLVFAQMGKKRVFLDWRSWLFYIATIIPPALYYIYIKSMAVNQSGFAKKFFIADLLKKKFFYEEWFFFIQELASWPVLLLGILGVLVFKKREGRFFVGSLWIIFFIIGIAFNHAINTYHDYYVLGLVPIFALSLGLLADSIVNLFRKWEINRYIQIAICGLLIILVAYNLRPVRWAIQKTDLTHRKVLSQEIGEIVNHSTKTIFLAPSFGKPLMYDAWIAGRSWPRSWLLWKRWVEQNSDASSLTDQNTFLKTHPLTMDDAQDLFEEQFKKHNPKYFIVTDFEEFQGQPGLQKFLTKNFPVLASTDWYLVFDLRHSGGT